MKEFIEKLIGRLEEESKFAVSLLGGKTSSYIAGCCDTNKKTIKIVNQLAEEYNNAWVQTSERLPERNKNVLCWAKSTARGGDCCFVGSCDNGFWFLQSSIGTLSYPTQYEVVAWRELPEPYQPKGE